MRLYAMRKTKTGRATTIFLIEFIVQPGDTHGYEMEKFLAEDDPEYIRYCEDEEYNDDTWYLITGS